MGKLLTKPSTLPHLQGLEVRRRVKTVENNEQVGNISPTMKKRNTYVPYYAHNSSMTGESKITMTNKTVEDKSQNTEGLDSDPSYVTVGPEDSSISDSKLLSKPDYENIPYQASSIDEGRFQNDDEQINKTGKDGTENQLPAAYENVMLARELKQMFSRKKPGRPECEEALSLRRHYRELKRRILVESVCDHFIQGGVLKELDLENIMRGSYPRHARVDLLLQIVLRKKSQNVFKAFNRALRNTGFQDLADKLENTKGVEPEKEYMRDWSSNDIINVWSGIKEVLLEELQPEYILDYFMQENIFSVDEYEEIFWSMGRRMEMTKILLEIMKQNLPEAMFVLLYALKEVDEENKDMVERLEKLIATGNDKKDDSKDCGEKQSNTDVQLVTVHETAFSDSAPSSTKPRYSVEISVKKDGYVMEKVEGAIDKYMKNPTAVGLLEKFLSLTDCELTESERGCVIIHLLPHSKHAFDKLSKFCKNGEITKFVLNLLREKDICSSLSGGEICINIQLKYNDGELESKDTEETGFEIEPDLTTAVRDNWSFLCEEVDVKDLISDSVAKTVFTDQETSEIEGRAVKDRHQATDYFLKCLLEKGPRGIQFLMNALKDKNYAKIIKRLQRSGPVYKTPEAVKENLLVHFELLVEEIDPSQFKDTFVDRNILDRKFFTDLRENHPRRRCRAALFLREVLNRGNRAIQALVDVMTEMDCDVLLAKLIPTEEKLSVPKQERKAFDRNEDAVTEIHNASSPETLIWSCCLEVNVEIKGKDETKHQIYNSFIEKEESFYENVQLDEGIGGTENESSRPLRSKQGKGQTTRSIIRSECNLSKYPESELAKCLTYPITRESSKKNLRSLITSVADSGIDVSVATNETISALRNIHSK